MGGLKGGAEPAAPNNRAHLRARPFEVNRQEDRLSRRNCVSGVDHLVGVPHGAVRGPVRQLVARHPYVRTDMQNAYRVPSSLHLDLFP